MMKKMLMALALMPLMALAGTLSFEAESSNPSVAGGLWIEAVEDTADLESLNQRINAGETAFFNGARPVSGFTQAKQMPCCCFAVKMTGSQAGLIKVDIEVETPSGTFTSSHQANSKNGFCGGFSMNALFNLKVGTYTLRATASADGCRPVTTAIKFTVKGTGRTVRSSLGYISLDADMGDMGFAGCSVQGEDGWIGVSQNAVMTTCLGNNESAQLLVHYDRPVFIVFDADMAGNGDEFSVTVTADGFSPSRYELSSGKGYYVGCMGQDGRSGGSILWQYKRGSSKLLLQDVHCAELYNFRCYDVIKVSFDSAGGGTVPPILAVCGHAYNAIEQFPENGPTPPKSKNGEKYEFEGWYNSEGVRVTGNSMVPEYSDDHTLMARWKVSGDERPDLYIASASASPVTIMLSERTAIKYTLVNGGKKSAGQTSTHFVADTCWTSLGNGPLAAGASETCTKHISGRELGLGTHQIRIQADAPNDVEESNEDNNSCYVIVVVINDNPQPYVPSGQTVRVSFDPKGGIVVESMRMVDGGGAIGVLPVPVRDGFEFVGWFTAAVGGTKVSEETVVTADMVLYAHWCLEGAPACVPGENVTIDTGLIGYTASGLPSGLKYNKTTGMITGSASKPTAAEGVVVKFTKSGEETEELTIVVTAIPKVTVEMEGVNSPGDTDGCKVTGAGAYLVGKTVTLKATVPKGTVFMGWGDDEGVVSTQATYSFTMGKENVALVARFKKEVMSVGCEVLSTKESFPAGVLGAEGGIRLDISTESGVKSVKVDKLPAGMKYDTKTGLITGAPTKTGDNKVVITVTAQSGAVAKKEIEVSVAAMPVMAVGTFTGFVSVGEDNFGTFTLTTTDAGKLTAKVVTAAGAVSFSGTYWDSVEDGVYRAALTTKKGETLTLVLDSNAAWDANQLSGAFTTALIPAKGKSAEIPSRTYSVSAQRNAFGKTWYFAADGNEAAGWTLAYTENVKSAALTVTLKADGSTAIAGSLPNGTDTKGKAVSLKVSASGYANVGGMTAGVIMADFAPIVTVNKVKRALSIHTNLWFDRSNSHEGGAGSAALAE